MRTLWTTSAAISYARLHGADVTIDPWTLRCVKDRAQGKPGRMATDRELAEAHINTQDDDEYRRTHRIRMREIFPMPNAKETAMKTSQTEIDNRFRRVLAHLIRNEGVAPEAIERAVASALSMRMGEVVPLDGDGASLRRAFINEQMRMLMR
jgi:hypothetical protein